MTNNKINEVLDRYEDLLCVKLGNLRSKELIHLRDMIPKIQTFLREGRKEKAMRWLGFMQGVLWSTAMYTLEDLKNHNRPDEIKETKNG